MFNQWVVSLQLLIKTQMEATAAKAAFHSIHFNWDSFISVFKFGILNPNPSARCFKLWKPFEGNFYSQQLKRVLCVVNNMFCYIKGENKSLVHQNRWAELVFLRAASMGSWVRKWGHPDITSLLLSSVHVRLFWLIQQGTTFVLSAEER